PALEDAFQLQPEVVVQAGGGVLLDDELAGPARTSLGGDLLAGRLTGEGEVSLLVVFAKAHRVACPMLNTSPHADVPESHPHAQGSPLGGGGPLAHLHGARRLSPEGRGGGLLVPAARLARREEGRADH